MIHFEYKKIFLRELSKYKFVRDANLKINFVIGLFIERINVKIDLFFMFAYSPALVAELVDALDSKSSSFESVGSIPTQGTSFHIYKIN